MALTNSRPLNLLDNGENDILHNSTSPIFQFSMTPSLAGSMTSNSPNNSTTPSSAFGTTTTTNNNSSSNSNSTTTTTTNNNSSIISPISNITNKMANTTTAGSNSVNNIPEINNSLSSGSDIVNINDINPPVSENTMNDVMTHLNTTAQTTPTSTSSAGPNKNSLSLSTTNNINSISATTSTTVTSSSSSSSTSKKSNNTKAAVSNNPLNNPIVEISKLIPVTGERPRPVEDKTQFDDDVLFAVFIILYEMDPEQNGMTVKQLCDYLLIKHPEMSNLSTKLSNLISAKLNAYVKKIEKGEKTLIYAISREWSAASPRRMLYIYRGILAPDYKEQAQLVASKLKKQMAANIITTSTDKNNNNDKSNKKNSNNGKNNNNNNNNNLITSFNNIPQNVDLTSFDATNYNYRQANNLNFTFPPEFNIPYSTSPVSATLNNTSHEDNHNNINMNYDQNNNILINNIHDNENMSFNEAMKSNKKNGSQGNTKKRAANDMTTIGVTNKNNKKNNDSIKSPNKRPKTSNIDSSYSSNSSISTNQSMATDSQSTIVSTVATINNDKSNGSGNGNGLINIPTNSDRSESNYITAVAAAPRISKYLPRSNFSTPNNSSTNIHQLLTLQTPILNSRSQSKLAEKNNGGTVTLGSDTTANDNNNYNDESQEQKHKEEYWINMVRSGFLTRDISKPESISIDDLDSMF